MFYNEDDPLPTSPNFSAHPQKVQRDFLIIGTVALSGIYVALHKVMVPFISLHFMDLWEGFLHNPFWLGHFLIVWSLLKKNNRVMKFGLAGLILFVVATVFEIPYAAKWMMISHVLAAGSTSVTIAILFFRHPAFAKNGEDL